MPDLTNFKNFREYLNTKRCSPAGESTTALESLIRSSNRLTKPKNHAADSAYSLLVPGRRPYSTVRIHAHGHTTHLYPCLNTRDGYGSGTTGGGVPYATSQSVPLSSTDRCIRERLCGRKYGFTEVESGAQYPNKIIEQHLNQSIEHNTKDPNQSIEERPVWPMGRLSPSMVLPLGVSVGPSLPRMWCPSPTMCGKAGKDGGYSVGGRSCVGMDGDTVWCGGTAGEGCGECDWDV